MINVSDYVTERGYECAAAATAFFMTDSSVRTAAQAWVTGREWINENVGPEALSVISFGWQVFGGPDLMAAFPQLSEVEKDLFGRFMDDASDAMGLGQLVDDGIHLLDRAVKAEPLELDAARQTLDPKEQEIADHEALRQAENEARLQAERDLQAQAERDLQAQAERDVQAQAERDVQAQAERDVQAQAEREVREAAERRTREAAEARER